MSQVSAKNLNFARPNPYVHPDLLFESTYVHSGLASNGCASCDKSKLIPRSGRVFTEPRIHHGIILSGNQLMRNARERDRLGELFNAVCFEMESAGLYEACPCIVIRGICNYADSHKEKSWQCYAALAAAAYAKEVVCPSLQGKAMFQTSWQRSLIPLIHWKVRRLASLSTTCTSFSLESWRWASGSPRSLWISSVVLWL